MNFFRSFFCIGMAMITTLNSMMALDNNAITDVTAFGAKGDGITDDTAAIQKAFDQIRKQKYGGTVIFPNGNFIISAPIDVKYNYMQGLTISGMGSRQSCITYKGEGILFNVESESPKHSGFIDTFIIKDIFLRGADKKGTTALRLSKLETPFIISNCRFELWGDFALILDKYAMEGSISNCAFNTNSKGILFNGYNDRVVLEKTSFWKHEYECLRICSTRVRVQNCFFGNAGTSVIFSKGPLQSGSCSSFIFCDFEGQRDMKCFIEIGDKNSKDSVFRELKFMHCRFGVNPKSLNPALAGDELLKNTSKKEAHEIPVCFLINNPIYDSTITGCKFINIKEYAVESKIKQEDMKKCVSNNYEHNSVENALNANGVHFSSSSEKIFQYKSKNHPEIASDKKE